MAALAYSAVTGTVYTAGADGHVCELDADSGVVQTKWKVGKTALTALAVSAGGDRLMAVRATPHTTPHNPTQRPLCTGGGASAWERVGVLVAAARGPCAFHQAAASAALERRMGACRRVRRSACGTWRAASAWASCRATRCRRTWWAPACEFQGAFLKPLLKFQGACIEIPFECQVAC